MNVELNDQPSYIFKICLLGAGGVGKTCVARRLCFDTFDANTKLTIGIDFYTYDVPAIVNGNKTFIRLSIWDFGGQEQFRKMFSYYINGANGIFMVFSLVNLNNTLLGLDWWFDNLLKFDHQKSSKILVGCKSDLIEGREKIDELVIQNFREKHNNLPYFDTSAKVDVNIRDIFVDMTKRILDTNKFEYDEIF